MLYKVTVGQDVYVGTPEEIVGFMARADGAPAGGPAAYMEGIAARLATHGRRVRVDRTSALDFLASLGKAGLLRLERRKVPREDRVDPRAALGDGPVAFGSDVSDDDLRDLLSKDGLS